MFPEGHQAGVGAREIVLDPLDFVEGLLRILKVISQVIELPFDPHHSLLGLLISQQLHEVFKLIFLYLLNKVRVERSLQELIIEGSILIV